LSKKSDSLKFEIKKLTAIVADFNAYIDGIKAELYEKAGGEDPNYSDGRPLRYKDKNATNQLFLIEKRGFALKNKIDSTRQILLNFINPYYRNELSSSIPLTTNEDYINKNKRWEDIKFKDMPVAAVLPTLTKCQADARTSERVILDYWRLIYK
jgi:hypothetical protein